MSVFVLDCSVAISWCFEDESPELSKQLLLLLRTQKAIVPPIWSLEISNVLAVAQRAKRISAKNADAFVNLLHALPIKIDNGLDSLINRHIIAITRQHHISAYDAAYLELALRYGTPLASFDRGLCAIAKKEGVELL